MLGQNAEHWDYVIRPNDGTARGIFSVLKFDVTAGQTITIKYAGIVSRVAGHMLVDGYPPSAEFTGDCIADGSTTWLLQCSKLLSDDGIFSCTASRNGTITVGDSRTAEAGSNAAYACSYIKIRFEN